MNKVVKELIALICILGVIAISPALAQNEQKGFSFQGYARDFSGAAYSNSTITVQFSIYPEGESVEYTEQQSAETDAYGVFHAVIGSVASIDFSNLNFSLKNYFMKVEVKVAGGDFVEISNTELLAVPYAKAAEQAEHAKTAVQSERADSATHSSNGTPVGVILPFAGPKANIPDGYLPCDGSSVAISDFPSLHAVIGDSWGGDGSTAFNLPNFEGRFMRGWSDGAGTDPDRNSRSNIYPGGNTGDAIGTYQGDQFRSHNHTVRAENTSFQNNGPYTNRDDAGSNDAPINVATSNAGGSETRPQNAYVLFIIKY